MTEDEKRKRIRGELRRDVQAFWEWYRVHEAPVFPQVPAMWAYQGYEPGEEQVQSWAAMRERWKDEADR